MSVLDNQPSSHNFFNPANHRLVIKRCPNIVWFTQKVSLPDIVSPTPFENNPFAPIPHAGDRIDFAPLSFQFVVQEDLGDYLEIFRWMEALGHPEAFDQYRELQTAGRVAPMESTGLKSEISVMLLDSAQRPIMDFVFHHAFPYELSGFQLDTTDDKVSTATATAKFRYVNFEVNPVVRANCDV